MGLIRDAYNEYREGRRIEKKLEADRSKSGRQESNNSRESSKKSFYNEAKEYVKSRPAAAKVAVREGPGVAYGWAKNAGKSSYQTIRESGRSKVGSSIKSPRAETRTARNKTHRNEARPTRYRTPQFTARTEEPLSHIRAMSGMWTKPPNRSNKRWW